MDDRCNASLWRLPRRSPKPQPHRQSYRHPWERRLALAALRFFRPSSLPPGYGAPPPSPQVVTPPPVPSAPTIGVGGQGPFDRHGGQAPIIGSAHQPQFGGQVTPPNQDVVDDSELSGSLRVPVLLLSAVGFCLSSSPFRGILLISHRQNSPPGNQTVERIETYVEPDSPPVEICRVKTTKGDPNQATCSKEGEGDDSDIEHYDEPIFG